MKNPFKSKYYYAIIDKIAELENERDRLEFEKAEIIQGSPGNVTLLSIYIADIKDKINVLRGLL